VRFPFIAAVLLALLPALAIAEDNAPVSLGQETLARIKEAFPYDPAVRRDRPPRERAADDEEVLAMEPFSVVEEMLPRSLRERIEHGSEKDWDRRFSLLSGGSLFEKDFGKVRMEFGPVGIPAGFTLLRFSW
jgi:hypothetical protein